MLITILVVIVIYVIVSILICKILECAVRYQNDKFIFKQHKEKSNNDIK
jgi:hypothetical protein